MTDRSTTVGAAAVFLFPAVAALWKSASLRGDTHRKWAQRVELADAALTQAAVDELVQLQGDLGALLTDSGSGFDPAMVMIDPEPLVKRTDRINRLLSAKNGLRPRLRRHCQLGPVLMAGGLIYLVGWAISSLYFLRYGLRSSHDEAAGIAIVALAVFVFAAVFVAYAYYENKLADAEILAEPPS